MDTPDNLERLTLLERAQLLHDATLRRHGEMLDRHEAMLERHDTDLIRLTNLVDMQTQTQRDLADVSRRLTELVESIRDMLRRDNGR